jgi:hypothetical protein
VQQRLVSVDTLAGRFLRSRPSSTLRWRAGRPPAGIFPLSEKNREELIEILAMIVSYARAPDRYAVPNSRLASPPQRPQLTRRLLEAELRRVQGW